MDMEVLQRIEQQRIALEENITKLRKSLRHWQGLELDYEGLREEFALLPPDASKDDCLRAAKDFGPIAVDEKDLLDLIVDKSSISRSPRQLGDLLSKRVDYVARNADTIRKQITSEEKRLNALLLAEDPELRDDAGLPLTEITEVLDDDGNVISSKVDRPASGAAGLAEVLEKAGVDGIVPTNGKINVKEDIPSTKATVASSSRNSVTSPSGDWHEGSDYLSDDDASQVVLQNAAKPGSSVRAGSSGENPIPVRIRDTEEEAQMRREMLEYGLDEVGAIVAELDMQEGGSDISYDEDDDNLIIDSDSDFIEDDEDDDEDESEDEFGRVKNPVISEKYKQKMQELEKRLGLTDLKNLGPDPSLPADVQQALERPPAAEAARKAALARYEANAQDVGVKKKKKSKKSVAFAETLDIADEDIAKRRAEFAEKPAENPVGETILERNIDDQTTSDLQLPPAPAPSKPASRFKSARRAAASVEEPASSEPSNDPSRPLIAPHVLERPTSTRASAPDLDSIDDEMHRRQIAMEYHNMRNAKIHAQGGYMQDDEQDEWDEMTGRNVVVDEETGEVKKISRFKAARLKG